MPSTITHSLTKRDTLLLGTALYMKAASESDISAEEVPADNPYMLARSKMLGQIASEGIEPDSEESFDIEFDEDEKKLGLTALHFMADQKFWVAEYMLRLYPEGGEFADVWAEQASTLIDELA